MSLCINIFLNFFCKIQFQKHGTYCGIFINIIFRTTSFFVRSCAFKLNCVWFSSSTRFLEKVDNKQRCQNTGDQCASCRHSKNVICIQFRLIVKVASNNPNVLTSVNCFFFTRQFFLVPQDVISRFVTLLNNLSILQDAHSFKSVFIFKCFR